MISNTEEGLRNSPQDNVATSIHTQGHRKYVVYPKDLMHKVGDDLDRMLVHHRFQLYRHTLTHLFTHSRHFKDANQPTTHVFGLGRKPWNANIQSNQTSNPGGAWQMGNTRHHALVTIDTVAMSYSIKSIKLAYQCCMLKKYS